MDTTELKVIIAGAGIGGLCAAISLELAGADYTVLEQSPADDPSTKDSYGGAVQVGPTALHFLRQLGIYEEIQHISKPVSGVSMNEHDMSYVGRIDLTGYKERHDTPQFCDSVMARSQLHTLLRQRVPPKRIVHKMILGIMQDATKVTVRCSDGTIFEGDILIAADGAFSNVRHGLYWTLDEKKQLPKADAVPMSVDLCILSGRTKPLEPSKYSVLMDSMSEIQSVQAPDQPYTVWFIPMLDNRIAWDITHDIPKTAIRQGEASRVYQWPPHDIEQTLDVVKKLECPYGGLVGDLLETTEVESMFMHMTEERLCETWHDGRVVLLGDDCTSGGLGTLHSMPQADLQSDSMEDITGMFKAYRERRAVSAKAAVEQSGVLRQVFTGKGRAASLRRSVVFNYMPERVRNMVDDKRNEYRPQLSFLPQVKDRGTVVFNGSRPPSRRSSSIMSTSSPTTTEATAAAEAPIANGSSATLLSDEPKELGPEISKDSRPVSDVSKSLSGLMDASLGPKRTTAIF
ncbi:hypothetical protein BGW38_002117 [Lunasporangiospora selenospora]|uniref:FAD-binding domain-containing protein n=1 Tax=Lunasporangiospora selenospora TaxID=979761 RepID=A0A9P6FSU3_9FUNG|nr:hypothetical protein BGW38_002117 [Lunasporangiospora selenospora]